MMFKPFMNLFPYPPPKENLLGKKIQDLNKQDSLFSTAWVPFSPT